MDAQPSVASAFPDPIARRLASLLDRLPDEAADDLVSPAAGTAVRWTPGSGWRKARE